MAEKKVIEIEIKDNISATQDHFNDLRNEIKTFIRIRKRKTWELDIQYLKCSRIPQ